MVVVAVNEKEVDSRTDGSGGLAQREAGAPKLEDTFVGGSTVRDYFHRKLVDQQRTDSDAVVLRFGPTYPALCFLYFSTTS